MRNSSRVKERAPLDYRDSRSRHHFLSIAQSSQYVYLPIFTRGSSPFNTVLHFAKLAHT